MSLRAFSLPAATALWLLGPAAPSALAADRVAVTAAFEPAEATPGGTAALVIKAKVSAGFHIYAPDSPEAGGVPTRLEYSSLGGLTLEGPLAFPEPDSHYDDVMEVTVRTLDGTVELRQPFLVPAAASGVLAVAGTLRLQACDDRGCVLEEHEFAADLRVAAVAGAKPPAALALPGAGQPVTATASFAEQEARAGATATLRLNLRIAPRHHVYGPDSAEGGGRPAKIELEGSAVRAEGAPAAAPTIEKYDDIFEVTVRLLEGEAVIEQPLRLAAGLPAGPLTVKGTLLAEACDDSTCEEVAVPFQATLAVLAADPAAAPPPAPAAAAPPANTGGPPAAAAGAERSLGAFLLAAIAAALLALLTPCVFPMIPITVSVFAKQAETARGSTVFLATVYSLGIVATFTLLGVLTSVLVGPQAANAIASNPWVNVGLGLLFVLFALSLLGAFEIRLPNFLVHGAAELQQKKTGVVAVLLMGFVFTLTSFTCTVAFVGNLLVEAAKGDVWWPVIGMLAFSATFAFPFFFLALFPSAMQKLPQAGGWMNSVKIVMGLLEVGFAFKFLSNADMVWELEFLTRPVFLAAWVALGLLTTLYLLGRIRMSYDDEHPTVGPGRLLTSFVFGWITLYLASGFTGTTFGEFLEGWLPQPEYGQSPGAPKAAPGASGAEAGQELVAGLAYFESYEAARARALLEQRALFLDFTGVTCNNCRAMERKVFPLPEVQRELGRFVRAQLYVDRGAAAKENAAFQKDRFGVAAQPFYAVVDPATGEELGRFDGYANTPGLREQFVQVLKAAADRFEERKVAKN